MKYSYLAVQREPVGEHGGGEAVRLGLVVGQAVADVALLLRYRSGVRFLVRSASFWPVFGGSWTFGSACPEERVDQVLGLVVLALAELEVADGAVGVDQVLGPPVLVAVVVPGARSLSRATG
ncbi:hypothetical protein [Streptomyces niveus]|uniref:hypothetical protein n=1 Tax=Streptomyces niveus TaxID=193462 RepID=UPI001939A1BB|nr:hypothetical protein [Streptomyces niveus]